MEKTHINFPTEVTEILGFLTGMIEFQETGIGILAGEAGAVTGEAEAGTGGVEAETSGVEAETGGVEVGNGVAVIDHLAGIERGEIEIGIAMEMDRKAGGGVGRMRLESGGEIEGEVGVHLRGIGDR